MTDSIYYLFITALFIVGLAFDASAQPSAKDLRGPAPVLPLASEPNAKLVVDPPLPEPLALGRVVIQYRTENLRIMPVFGPAALDVSPRIGHLHITVDGGPWRWVDTSNEPLIINKLPAGPHRILIEMVDPNHQLIEGKTIEFIIPKLITTSTSQH
jgi:hypothetical protein